MLGIFELEISTLTLICCEEIVVSPLQLKKKSFGITATPMKGGIKTGHVKDTGKLKLRVNKSRILGLLIKKSWKTV